MVILTKVGISDLCAYDQDGKKYQNPVFPYRIKLEPNDVHFTRKQPKNMKTFMAQFTKIPLNTSIYALKGQFFFQIEIF